MDTEEITHETRNKKGNRKQRPPPPVVLHGATSSHGELAKLIGRTATKRFTMKYTRNNIYSSRIIKKGKHS